MSPHALASPSPPPLQVGVNVIAPAEVLAADPLPDAVAVMQLAVAASAHRAGGVKVRLLRMIHAHCLLHVGCRWVT